MTEKNKKEKDTNDANIFMGSMPGTRRINSGSISNMKAKETKRLAILQSQYITTLESVMSTRRNLSNKLGMSYSGDRDLYEALGWKQTLEYSDYRGRYERDGVAKRIIDALPAATWRGKPLVSDNTEEKSPFEEKWKELVNDGRIYNTFLRADKLARIGGYSTIFLGFNDGLEPDKPVTGNVTDILYMTPYSEQNVEIIEFEMDAKNERYGKPKFYKLDISSVIKSSDTSTVSVSQVKVHWSRIIHVVENALEDTIIGIPALQACFNYLCNIDLIAGSSGEMFWRGAFPGLNINLQNDADFQMNMDDMQEELEAYIHDMQRYIRTEGMDVKTIEAQLISPREFVQVQFMLISTTTGIPMRLLTGSERGQLASTQDERNWLIVINDRREDFADAVVLRPFIDRLIEVGVIPEPNENKYEILWDDLFALGEKESAEIAEIKAKTIKTYTEAAVLGAEQIIPVKVFQKELLNFSDEQIDKIEETANEMLLLDSEPPLQIEE